MAIQETLKPVCHGVSEIRIDYGPGYRVYFLQKELRLVILLAGGNERTQQKDIKKAVELASNLWVVEWLLKQRPARMTRLHI